MKLRVMNIKELTEVNGGTIPFNPGVVDHVIGVSDAIQTVGSFVLGFLGGFADGLGDGLNHDQCEEE